MEYNWESEDDASKGWFMLNTSQEGAIIVLIMASKKASWFVGCLGLRYTKKKD